jgi:S-adenosylmethionine/arginine decarboxylase-like enzyme
MRVSGLTEFKNIIQCQSMDNKLLVHKHLIVRAKVYRPPMDEEFLRRWLNTFITEIGMKVMMGPYVQYSNMVGNRGITGAAIIETSHIVMHVWDEVHPALMQFDVYSCGEFNPETICNKIEKDFTVHKIEYKFLDREHDLKELHTLTYTDPIAKNYASKEIEMKNNILMKSRKEVEINGNGTSGYTIKEGIHKGTVLGHISREKSVLEN